MNKFTINTTNLYRSAQRLLLAITVSVGALLVVGGVTVFAADPPAVTSVVPASAYNAGGDSLTITGTGFSAGATVTVGGFAAASVVVQSDTVITATTPSSFSVGSVILRVTNSDQQYAETQFTYIQTAPSLISASPNRSVAAGGQAITLTGGGFQKSLRFKEVAAGNSHALAIAYDGTLYAWGLNSNGQLGNGSATIATTPTPVDMSGVLAGKRIIAVATGDSFSLALDSDGKVYSWGSGGGRLGTGNTAASSVPVAVDTSGVLANKTIKAISAGSATALVLATDGTLYAWGGNASAQIGDNGYSTRNAPVAVNMSGVLSGKTIAAISMGATHAVAADTNGVVYAWGANAYGQLGDNSTITKTVPVAVYSTGLLANKVITSVSAGNQFTVVVDSTGKAYSWGMNTVGQLGNNTSTSSSNTTPVAVTSNVALSGKVLSSVSASASGSHVIALDTAGVAYGWGANSFGQLGDNAVTNRTSPVVVNTAGVLSGKNVKRVSTNGNFSHAIDSEGVVYAWGQNNSSQLGNGGTSNSSIPLLTNLTIPIVSGVTFGGATAQITGVTSTTLTVTAPAHAGGSTPITLSGPDFSDVTLSNSFDYLAAPVLTSVAPSSGYSSGGDTITLIGSDFSANSIVKIGGISAEVVSITPTAITVHTPSQSYGLRDVMVTDSLGQTASLTDAFTYVAPDPSVTNVNPASGPISGGGTVTIQGNNLVGIARFVQTVAGASSACGLTSEGKVYCWGLNNNSQLGTGTSANSTIPVPVVTSGVLSGKKIVAISAGDIHMLALDSEGKVYAWGSNASAQLGNGGSSGTSNVPVEVNTSGAMAGKTITAIAAGQTHSLALDSEGKVYAWGTNSQGRLGTNQTNGVVVTTPSAVFTGGALNGKRVVTIDASAHSIAVDSDGIVYTWGYNSNGQLGNNTASSTTNYATPVAVTTASTPMAGKKLVSVAAGLYHSLAVDDTGAVYAWGNNANGQLGNNSVTTEFRVPVAVTSASTPMDGKKIVAVSGGVSHSLALAEDGTAYSWGNNNIGQLGNNSTTQSRIPVAIMSDQRFIQIGASAYNTASCATIVADSYCWGNNGNGQAGDGTQVAKRIPTIVDKTNIAQAPVVETVSFGGVSVPVLSHTASSITVHAPAHAEGLVDLVLSGANINNTTVANGYEYIAPPSLNSVTPSTGLVAGGDSIVLSGSKFSAGSTVSIGGVSATVTNLTATAITVVTPAHLAGVYDVSVTDVLGQTSTATGAFTYLEQAPVVTSITPSRGPVAGGQNVTIKGSYFSGSRAASDNNWVNTGSVITGGTYGSSFVVVGSKMYLLGGSSSNKILSADVSNPTVWTDTNKVLPATLYGSQAAVIGDKVYLFGGYGSSAIYSADVSDPTTWINTGKIMPGGAREYSQIAVIGSKVYGFGGVNNATIYSADVSDPTTWASTGKTLPTSLGYSQVVVLNEKIYLFGGISGNLASSVIYSANVSDPTTWTNTGKTLPETLQLSQLLTVGDNLYLVGGAATGTACHTKIFSASADDPTTWTNTGKTLPIARCISAGAIIGDSMYLFGGYPNQSILKAEVTGMTTAGYNRSWITNYPVGPPSSGVVSIGGLPLVNMRVVDSETITGSTPEGTTGLADLTVTNYDNQADTLEDAYEYVAPAEIISVTPASGSIAGGESVYVTGTNFTSNTKVHFGTSEASVTFINATTLLAITPASLTPSSVDVTVTDEFNQTDTLTAGYTYRLPAPTISSVTPEYTKMTGGATMTITGSGFVNKTDGGSWYEVRVDGAATEDVQYVNATTLRFTAPTHAPGAVSVTIGGAYSDEVTLTDAFKYLPEAYEFTNPPRTLMATEPGEFTVRMLDENGQPVVSTSNIVLSLSSDSDTGFFARALSGQNAGWDFDTVIVPAGQSEVTFYYRDTTAGTPTITVSDPLNTSSSQQVTINSRYKMLVTGISNPTQVGTPSSVTVQAVDYTGAPQADYRGTIHFTSTDGGATLPADYEFTANDRGRKTFVNGVTMGTMGVWDVVVTDVSDGDITGTQEGVVVEAPASGAISQLSFITPAQSFPLDETSGVITVQTRDVNGVPIPVTQNTTVYLRTDSSTGQFSYDGGATWSNSPSATTIVAGSSYRNLLYRDTTAGSYQLKVSQQADTDFGWQAGTQSVSVGVGAPAKLGLDFTNGGSIGDWVPVEVTLTDTSNNRVTSPEDLPVRVSVQNGADVSLTMDGQNPSSEATTFIMTGEQSVTVWIRTTSEPDITVTATDIRDIDPQDLYDEATAVVRFGEATPVGVLFSTLPAQTTVRTATLLRVSITDQFGNIVVVPETTEVTLTSDSADGEYGLTANGPWASSRTVEIPAGATAASVYFRNQTVNSNVSLEATSTGLDPVTGSIDVKAGPYAGKIRFTTDAPTSIVAGENTTFTVELLDAYGNPTIASETVEIGFGTNRPATATWDGVAAVSPSGPGTGYTLSIPAGQGTVSAMYRSTISGTSLLRIYDQARWERTCLSYEYINGPCALWSGWLNSSLVNYQVTIEAENPGTFVITSQPQVITKNTASAPITVQMQDQYGNAASFDTPFDATLMTNNGQYGAFALSSSGPFTATQLSFAPNQSSGTFYYKSSGVSAPQGDMLIVSGGSLMAGIQNIRVIDGVASRALLDTEGQTTALAGDIVPLTLKTQTDEGLEVIVLNDTTFTLSSTEGEFSLTESPFVPVTSISLPAETSQRQLFYRSTVAGPTTLTAQSQNIQPVESELAILSTDFYKLGYSKLPASQRVEATKTSESMVATAYDEYGNVSVPSEDNETTVGLSSSKAAGEFALQPEDWSATETSIAAGGSTTDPFYYRIGTLNQAGDALTDASVLGAQTITAASAGVQSAEAELRIVGGLANRIVFMTNQQSLRAGQVSQLIRVQLQNVDGSAAIATEDQAVNLSSLNLNDDGDFLAPRGNDVFSLTPGGDPITSVTVLAGQSVVEFYVMPQTAESHRIRVNSAVRNYDGGYLRTVSATQTLAVTAGEASRFTFTSSEQIVYPGKVSGPIKIAVTDDYGNLTVNETPRTLTLESSCTTGRFLTSPTGTEVSTVDMENGASEVVVYYRDTQASAAPCDITVSANGMQSATQPIVVREPVYEFAITSDPQTIIAGQTSAVITVETRDRFGNTAAVEDPITVEFDASSENHTISPTERTINNGGSSAQFTYRYDDAVSAPTTVRVTARDAAGVVMPAEQDITVVPGAVAAATFNGPSFSAVVGDYHLLKLQALNAYGKRTVASTDVAFNLATSAGSGAFYQKVGEDYQQITSATITAGSGDVDVYYRQTQTTRTMAGFNTPATVTATRSGIGTASTQATITAKTLSFSTGNFSAQASAYTPIRATISSPLPTDLTVDLSTTDTDGAFYESQSEDGRITSTIIPAGQTQSAQLYYRQTSQTDSGTPETLTAEPGAAPMSVWRGTVTASIYVNQFSQLVFVAPPTNLEQNQTSSFIVEARDDLGNVVPFSNSQNGYCIYVGSSSTTATITASNNTATGCIDANGKTAVYVGQYQTRATFTFKDVTTGTSTITAANNSGSGGIRQSVNVTIDAASTDKVAFDRSSYNLVRGGEMNLSVRLMSTYDFPVNTIGQANVTLTSDSSSGEFYDESIDRWVTSLTVTVPAGQTEVTGIRYTDATTDNSTIIRAAASGVDSAQATVLIGVGAVEGLVFKNAPTSLERGEQATFTVGFVDAQNNTAPATSDFCLYITSNGLEGTITGPAGGPCSDMTLPGGQFVKAIQVAAGATEASFTYQTLLLGSTTLHASTLPTGGGVTADQAVTIVNGEAVRVGVVAGESTIERGGVLTGRAVLYNAYDAEVPTGSDITVRLTSDLNDGIFAIAGNGPWQGTLDVVIPANSSAVDFLYQSGEVYLGDIVLSAQAPTESLAPGDATVTAIMGEVAQLVFVTPELTTTATHPSQVITLEAQNRFGVEATVEADLQLYPRSNSTTGVFAASSTGPWGMSNTKILAGQSRVGFYYQDETVGTYTLTVRDKLSPQEGEEYLIATQQHHIVAQVFSHFIVTNISSPTRTGVASSAVVFAVDSENYVVAGYDGTITFSSDDPTAVLPGQSYTFQPEVDRGIHTFNNAVAFKTTGIKSVTVTDQNGNQGSQTNIEVVAGNSAPVQAIRFTNADTIVVDKNTATEALTVQLLDQSGAVTNAPVGGMPLRLTSDSATGQFSTDQTNWSSELTTSVEAGLSFSTTPIYYRDSAGGSHTVTVSDWIAANDNPAIANDTLTVTVRDLAVDVQQRIYSRDYKGNSVENPYLFSRNDSGDITGYTTLTGTARDFATGDEVIGNWDVRVGGVSRSIPSTARLSYQSANLTASAGDANYDIFVDVTSGSLTSSWQGVVPVSPWRAALGNITIDDTIVNGRLAITRQGEPADSPQAIIKVEGGVNQVVRTWNLSDLLASGLAQQLDRGLVSFRVPTRLFAGGNYSVSVQLSDGNGITAQDVIEFATVTPEVPVGPTVPGGPGDSGTISPETPGDTSRPEPTQPTPPRDGAYEQPGSGLLSSILKSPETPIRVAQSMLGILIAIVVVLAYQMYREWRHARFLLAIIRRDNETLANKDAFLQLASHHLRTPLTLLSSSSELLNMNPSIMVKQINQQLAGVIGGLKTKAEDILARTSASQEVAVVAATADEKAARRNVYRSPVFWVPVILTVVLTVAANWAVQTFGGQTIAVSTIASQVALLLLGGILLYTAARLLVQRRQQSQVLEQSRAKVKALNDVKVNFARQVGRDLTDDILHVNAYIQQLAPVTDATSQNLLKEGTERLERLVSRFTLLNSVYANTTQQDVVDMEKTVDEALRFAQQQNPAVSVSVDGSVDPITTRHARWMVSRLLQDVFTSMAPLVGSGVIKVSSRQTKDATTLTITGPSSHDAPAEDLFSVYSRADEELAGTYSTEDADNRMHRLDLYLDRMIADELQADLSAKRVGGQMQVTVELPNAA